MPPRKVSPENVYRRQLEGILANGLNPNLVYGSSGSVTGSAGAISPFKYDNYHSTAVPYYRGEDSLQTFLSTRLLQTQVAAQEANNRLINARADNEEARTPGVLAKSEETALRWRYRIEHPEEYGESLKASLAAEYWSGIKIEQEAKTAENKYIVSYFDREIAEWLNETEAPGTGMTYRQYMEHCKAFLPGVQYSKFKAEILDIASRMAYRAKQGQLLELKKEFQTYVNRLARYGRSLGNDWVTLLIAGLQEVFNGDTDSIFHMPIFDSQDGQMQTP